MFFPIIFNILFLTPSVLSHGNLHDEKNPILSNPENLINVTCDSFTYSTEWAVCVHNSNANVGSYTNTVGAKAEYTFEGKKFYILANREHQNAKCDIYLNNELVGPDISFGTIDGPNEPDIVFWDDTLEFGSYNVTIVNKGTDTIVLAGMYIDPLPSDGTGAILNFSNIETTYGTWQLSNTQPPYFYSTQTDASFYFYFYGRKFYLCGVRGSSFSTIKITIDYDKEVTINTAFTNAVAQNNIGILLYESEDLEFKRHHVLIHKFSNSNRIGITNLFYTWNNNDVIPEPIPKAADIPVSIPATSTGIISTPTTSGSTAVECQYTGGISPDTIYPPYNCGYKVWNNNGQFVERRVTFKGVRFRIYGKRSSNHGKYQLYLDDQLIGNINQKGITTNIDYFLEYESDLLEYGEHTIVCNGTEVFEMFRIAFWPDLRARRINISQFYVNNNWKYENDDAGGIRAYSTTGDTSVIYIYNISIHQLWLYGMNDPGHRQGQVLFGDIIGGFNQESSPRRGFVLNYESEYYQHPIQGQLVIKGLEKAILVHYVYVIPSEDDALPTAPFTKSSPFTPSKTFTSSSSFTFSQFFSASHSFTKSNIFDDSIIFSKSNYFSGSNSFTKSDRFSQSTKFTKSVLFSASIGFSDSQAFEPTMIFDDSSIFSKSISFSSSEDFSASKSFTISDGFSESDCFSSSESFTETAGFSESITLITKVPIDSDSNQTPDDSDSNQTPDDSDSNQTPDDSDSNQTSDDSDGNQTSDDSDGNQTSDDSDSNQTPDDSESNQTPDDSDSNQTPDDSDSDKEPDDSESNQTSDDSESNQTSDDSESNQTPDDSDSNQTSDDSESNQTPDDSESNQTSDDSESNQTPDDSESNQTPSDIQTTPNSVGDNDGNQSGDSSDSNTTTIIIGVVVAVLAILTIVIILVLVLIRRPKSPTDDDDSISSRPKSASLARVLSYNFESNAPAPAEMNTEEVLDVFGLQDSDSTDFNE